MCLCSQRYLLIFKDPIESQHRVFPLTPSTYMVLLCKCLSQSVCVSPMNYATTPSKINIIKLGSAAAAQPQPWDIYTEASTEGLSQILFNIKDFIFKKLDALLVFFYIFYIRLDNKKNFLFKKYMKCLFAAS